MCILWPPRLVLAMLVPVLAASEYEYINWKDIGHSYGKSPQCMAIPEDLRLCYTVGYHHMLLPNLLEHETMAEVKQQAGSWVPLVYKQCHPGTQIFLCSLFAPVCLDRPIYPCRRLCEAVRDNCSPIMEVFGFPWPEMLNCSKFPQDDVCIATNSTDTLDETSDESLCPPCDNEMSAEIILEQMCASEFAIKTKIKEARKENLDMKVILQKKRRQIKGRNLPTEELRNLVLYLKNGADCTCQQLDNLDSNYLILGRRVGKRYLLTGIHMWDTYKKEIKKAVRKIRLHKCSQYQPVFK